MWLRLKGLFCHPGHCSGGAIFNYIANIVFEIWMVNKFFEAVEKYLIINVDIALNQDGVRYLLVILMF